MVLSYVSLISFGPITVLVGRMSLNSSQHETEYRDHWLFFLSAGGQLECPSAMVVGRGARSSAAMGHLFFGLHSPLNKLSTILSTTTVLLFD